MRQFVVTSIIALTSATAFRPNADAAIVFTAGDLLLGFHATGGQGANDTYVFNLGPAIAFRDAPASFLVTSQPGFAALGADLTATFGSNWFTRTDLFWGASAVRSSSPVSGAVSGDPTRTLYVTRDDDDGGWSGISSTDRGNAANSVSTFQNAFLGNNGTAASNNRGAIIPTSQNNDWAEFNARSTTGPTAPSFNSFNPSIETFVGDGLNLYRILNSTTGANPSGTVGDGSLLGNIGINAGGAVTFSVVPEPASLALLSVGGSVLGLARRRRTPAVPSLAS